MSGATLAKPKWKPRDAVLPRTKILSQAEVIALLKRQVFDDATAAGWLVPRCEKPNARSTKIYAVSDAEDVQNRILAGEYPQSQK